MFEVRFIENDRLAVCHATGMLDMAFTEALLDFVETKEKELKHGFDRFFDMTAIEGISLRFDDIDQITRRREGYNPDTIPVRSVFYAVRPLAFGTARMYAGLLESARIRVTVLRDFEEACAWVAAEPPKIRECLDAMKG